MVVVGAITGVVAIGATALALWALGQRGAGGGQRVEFTYRPIFELGDRPYTEISNDGQRIVQVVRDTNGQPVASISVAAIQSRLGATRCLLLGHRLMQASAQITSLAVQPRSQRPPVGA